MKRKITIPLFFISMLVFCNLAFCTEYQTKQWVVTSITGSFSQDSNFRYFVEPQIRLIDEDNVFNQALLLTGLGYQLAPNLSVFAGPGLVVIRNTQGQTFQEYRFWQQLNWQILNSPVLLTSRTRFEEKGFSNQSQVGALIRQRLWLRIPIKNLNGYYYSMYDEVFFYFNRPSWVSPKVLEQNRAFLGVGKQLSKNTMMDFGYLNQFQPGPPRRVGNVILLSFNIALS